MAQCPSCKAPIAEGHRFCGRCGASLEAPDDLATITSWPAPPSPEEQRPEGANRGRGFSHPSDVTSSIVDADASPGPTASPSAAPTARIPAERVNQWSSKSSSDAWRFAPGQLLGGRYRVIGPLGKGGMGEVYHADDLKVGQQVALKFLPAHMSANEKALERMFSEVRVARQVSHANVCRVYDVGEVDGQHYISMEYVDGKDLASEIRRFGRLSGDKALELARQICAGVHAAHDRGVLHRDLKPANVMVDREGRARITDFGLAGLAAELVGQKGRAGTPAYMAPEQAAGLGVTPASDIYSLGLILFELFTGKPAFRPESWEEIKRLHESPPPRPSQHVPDIDERIENAVTRCLDRDPAMRPPSAIAVSYALPGGNPLAEALARGETPPPELVAASGARGVLKASVAGALVAIVAVFIVLSAVLGRETTLTARAAPTLARDSLIDRAKQIFKVAGAGEERADAASGMRVSADRRSIEFWHRESDEALIPATGSGLVADDNPAPQTPGSRTAVLSRTGTLTQLIVAPRTADTAATVTEEQWRELFEHANLKFAAAKPAPIGSPSAVAAGEFRAWIAPRDDDGGGDARVDATSLGATVTSFTVSDPESPHAPAAPDGRDIPGLIVCFVGGAVFLGAPAAVAAMNLRKGRLDKRGGVRLALAITAIGLLISIVGTHLPVSVDSFMVWSVGSFGVTLFAAVFGSICYLAIEPIIRRKNPESIIGWTRLLGGQPRDPVVGREIITGAVAGAAFACVVGLASVVAARGESPPLPRPTDLDAVMGVLPAIRGVLQAVFDALLFAMLLALLAPMTRPLSRLTAGVPVLPYALQAIIPALFIAVGLADATKPENGDSGIALWLTVGLAAGAGATVLLNISGVLTVAAAIFTARVLLMLPITFGLPSWMYGAAAVGLIALLGLIAYAFIAATSKPRSAPVF